MADVSAIFGIMLALAIVFPGLLFTVWLLFPHKVSQSEVVLRLAKWRALGVGILALAIVLAPAMILLNAPGGVGQLLGWVLIAGALSLASVGAAGLTLRMGAQLNVAGAGNVSPLRAFLGGAVALELAAAFPVIGWFLVIPAATLFGLGAAVLALFRWSPAGEATPASSPARPSLAGREA
jgi:hypothetical protein